MPITWRRGARMSRSSSERDHSMKITAVPEIVTSAMKEPPQIKSKWVKTPPTYQAGSCTNAHCGRMWTHLHAWINNEPRKKQYAINSTTENSTQPRAKPTPRLWPRQGESNVEVGKPSSRGSCAGQADRWAGSHFQSSAGKRETTAGRRRRDAIDNKATGDCLYGEEPGPEAHTGQPVHRLEEPFTSPVKHVTKLTTKFR